MPNNNREWLKRCFNCMEPVDTPDAKCAACGWDNHNRENKDTALEQIILKDQYIVGKSLGRGGFGITYVGFDTALERRIAIKEYFPIGTAYRFSDGITIRAYSEAEEDYQSGLDQALQESRTIAKLGQIPNVMQVYNVFIENGTVYMIMEYIDGVSLGEEVKRNGKLNWKEALHLMYPIMDALEKIHEQGLIHRDISPENIIRRKKTGEPVLLDFGSARQPKEGLTVMLKPGYAPAEQYSRSGEQDGRVDEYALCATMYYLVTGSAPASADLRLFAKKDLKRPSEYADDIPAEIEEVLLKGMELNSSDRYMSVKELHQAFLKAEQEAGKAGSSVKPSPPQPPKPERDADKAGSSVKPSPPQPPKPENREKNGLLKRVAGIAIAAAVGCLGGFLLFGNAGHDRNTEKEATVSSVQENAEETKGDEAVEAEKSEPTPAPEPIATNTPTPQPTATNTPTPRPTATNTPTPQPTEIPVTAELPRMKSDSDININYPYNATVLGSNFLRKEITEIKIEEDLTNAPSTAWDVSEAGDGNVLAWVTETSGEKTLTIAGEGGVSAPEDASYLFAYYSNMRKAELDGLNTQSATDLSHMFTDCLELASLDLSSFNTQNVTNMYGMFDECKSLTSLDLSSFNTQNVTNMYGMFDECKSLTSLDLSSFDTHSVTDMGKMYSNCQVLTNLDLSSFDTQNVTNMTEMFYNCQALTNLDLSSFDTDNVTNMYGMFYRCQSLTSLNLSSFDTHNVWTMHCMFYECRSLTNLDLSPFDTQNVTSMRGMFANCESLTSIDISNFDTSNADMTGMFTGSNLSEPKEISVSAGPPMMKSESFVGYDNMFSPTVLGSEILRSEITEIKIVDKSLKNAPAITWDVSEAGDGSVLARVTRSSKGTTLTIAGEGGVRAPADATGLFAYYYNLQKIDLSGLDTSNVTDMSEMFRDCKRLTSLNLSSFDTQNVTTMQAMFKECSSLTSLDLSSFDTHNVTVMRNMFAHCTSLSNIDLSNFDTSKADTFYMFEGAPGLSNKM